MIDMFERKEGGARDHFDVANETLICSRCKSQIKREKNDAMHRHVPVCKQGRSLVEDHIHQYENSPEGEVGRYVQCGDDKAQCTNCNWMTKHTNPSDL